MPSLIFPLIVHNFYKEVSLVYWSRCDSWVARFPCPLFLYKISVDRCSLKIKEKTCFNYIYLGHDYLVRFFFFFFVENSVVFNYTCSTSILNCSKFTDLWWYCFKILLQRKINSIQFHIYIPINSAKPPTGSRQVPVTNCNRRIFFSLSISLTNWSKNTAFNYIKISSTFEFFFFYLSFVDVRLRDAKNTIEQNFAVKKKNPQGLNASLKKVPGTCISLLMLKLTFQNHMTCLEFLW